MDQERLWAPWRLSYIKGDRSAEDDSPEPVAWPQGADRRCFVCRAAADYADDAAARRRMLIVARDAHVVALLNRYPYNNGHLLICPRRHVAALADLADDEHLAAMAALTRFTSLFAHLINADGFNIGLNLGREAGAGVPGHLHWHLVPRWPGDNNFMPVTAGIRVISQSLDALWEAVTERLDADSAGGSNPATHP